ncbi:MAG: cytochrome c oxidase subunit 3 [Nitrospirae bacterium]|nr:cytochrome c oxidase subunit 3 [Nitrospirota bacterium]
MTNEKTTSHSIKHHEAELSVWPPMVGLSSLLMIFGFMIAFQWKLPSMGMLVGGAGVVMLIISLFGWTSEVYKSSFEAGLSKTAIIVFILSEVALFGGLFGGYLYNMFPAPEWPPINTPKDVPPLGTALILSVFLLSSSWTIHKAEAHLEEGNTGGFKGWLFLTILLGGIFLIGQAVEWSSLIHEGFNVSTNSFGTFFYTITGFHGSHVLVGIILQVFILIIASRGRINRERPTIVRACGYYWHFVDGLWLLVLSLIYVLPSY